MSYRPKEDGSYVTSDSKGRGRRAGGLNSEQRRVGARNGTEVRKQRRHRRCSEALLLINLVLPLSQVAAETDAPGRRPTRSGAHVLACRSPELFVAQAWEFTRSGIVNSGDCVQFEDTPSSVEENRYRIQTSNDEYVCIQTVIQSQCFWTKAATLQHLGQGPQLSAQRLDKESSRSNRRSPFVRILLRAKRELNWIACFNATKAVASRQERNCTIISRRTNASV
jgi:predicted transcriptional regulator